MKVKVSDDYSYELVIRKIEDTTDDERIRSGRFSLKVGAEYVRQGGKKFPKSNVNEKNKNGS